MKKVYYKIYELFKNWCDPVADWAWYEWYKRTK